MQYLSGMTNNLLLYGANGYTGKIITAMAETYGLSPILAGRTVSAIQQLSDEFKLPYRISHLDDPASIDE